MDIPKPTDPFSNGQNIEIQDLKGNLWKSDSKGSNFIKIKDNVFVANIKGELVLISFYHSLSFFFFSSFLSFYSTK